MTNLLYLTICSLFFCTTTRAFDGPDDPVTIQLQKVSVQQGLRTVQVTVGTQKLNMLFNTGAGVTSISTTAAKACGLVAEGIIKNTDHSCNELSGTRIPLINVAYDEYFSTLENVLISDAPLQQLAIQGLKIDGVLSLSAFPNSIVTLVS